MLEKQVKETLRQVPNKGIGYGILKYLTRKENKQDLVFSLSPQIRFNYLGQFDEDVGNMTAFSVAKEQPGTCMSPNRKQEYDFNIEGIIINKQLRLIISFSKKQYCPETIENLINAYKEKLRIIIDYCSKKTEVELTPSDLDYKDLSIEELENFFN